MIGPGLIDYLISKVDKKENLKLTIKNCNDPIFLIPLLYKIKNLGIKYLR